MKSLETGKDKIQKICDAIRKETIDPAQQEAREIVENAHLQAAEIARKAKEKADLLKEQAQKEIEEKWRAFQSSLHLAAKQGVETIKQKIEQELFNKELVTVVHREMSQPDLIAQLIQGFVRSLEEQGVEDDFQVVIPQEISPRSINVLLTDAILKRLKERSVQIGDFHGGAQIRLKERHITIDISEEVVRELIARYIRRDFRELIFQ